MDKNVTFDLTTKASEWLAKMGMMKKWVQDHYPGLFRKK